MNDDRRDRSRPVTVINRFTVRGGPEDAATFQREFQQHSQYLRDCRGFDFLVTVQLVERPDVYVHLAHWRSLEDFLRIVHDERFLTHVRRLGALVKAEADQAVSVSRTLLRDAGVGQPTVMLTHATVSGEHAAFEARFTALTEHCANAGGFGGSDLLRSTVQPQSYFGLSWWRDQDDCDRTLRGDGYRRHLRELESVALVTQERTRHLAYETARRD